jgi:hypothetical protein
MNEQDLRERMEASLSAELGRIHVDPEPDLARGRKRLRRQRAISGFAAGAAIAVVAAAGVHFLPHSTGRDAATAAQEETDPAAVRAKNGLDLARTSTQLTAVLRKHVDAKGAYTEAKPQWEIVGAADSGKPGGIGELTVTQNWTQDGGAGLLWVSVAHKEHALDRTKWCGPDYTEDLLRFSCDELVTPNGRPILGGTAESVTSAKGEEYSLAEPVTPPAKKTGHRERALHLLWQTSGGGRFVRYERPDGQVVIVAVLRVNTLKRVADGLPEGVGTPDVTQEQLIAAATDPAMSLPN